LSGMNKRQDRTITGVFDLLQKERRHG
jgi:hypothetical protein